ncbi:hypothetical protein HHL16_00215 [Pseudoflavitalea sp. G-6-1-2]|uniref:hypothetical protein n=1 Tax=Pseudoflavitalea sp. G-6-1-2 TaxID=2728841 RepID=UPI00146CE735|nr:hypothetical protein [Pseudoflavitalea sp. G-6-1-2]NML19268.1 hypothetical protein [Pseudoflavitalea sp. G-6-1-2]
MDPLFYNLTPVGVVSHSWNDILKRNRHVNTSIKANWEASIEFLRQELGTSFFNNCGSEHPINLKLTTNIHLDEDLIDFVNNLKYLKNKDLKSYNILLQKIKPRLKCQAEGIPFTDVLRTFSRGGFDVKFLEPLSNEKSPDVCLNDPETGNYIYVEVSQLTMSSKQSDIQSQHRRIANAFMFEGLCLPCSFKQLQYLDESGVKRIIQQIRAIKETAIVNEQFISYEDDFIVMATSHPSKAEDLEMWCESKDIQINSMLGLPQNFNDTYRLVDNNKIAKKIKQLPVGQPGVIYLSVSFLYFFMMDIKETIFAIMDTLEKFPNCMGVILFMESCGSLSGQKNISIQNTKFVINKHLGLDRHFLYVHNLNFSGEIADSTFSRFIDSLK